MHKEWEFPVLATPQNHWFQEGIPMDGIIPHLRRPAKRRLEKKARKCPDGALRIRYLIIVSLAEHVSPTKTARLLLVARKTVYSVAGRFREGGEAGLVDRREENGERKLDDDFLGLLYEVVRSTPVQHGWLRPTWTREMLVETMFRKTGVHIDVTTMSRALAKIGARRGSPKPTVRCPWSTRARNRRLREILDLLENLPEDELAFWEDEVDIHLNPKIGLDWMVSGQQKEVLTPGKNEKRYLAGAQDYRTGELIWVEGEKKNSLLFLLLLWELVQRHPQAKVIHVILDNYSIHHTEQVKQSLETPEGSRLRLHFLPPYCPDHNHIERTWQDLHANVTRNHCQPDMKSLMRQVRTYLRRYNRQKWNTNLQTAP
jgi:transposase